MNNGEFKVDDLNIRFGSETIVTQSIDFTLLSSFRLQLMKPVAKVQNFYSHSYKNENFFCK